LPPGSQKKGKRGKKEKDREKMGGKRKRWNEGERGKKGRGRGNTQSSRKK
jgi:hypothetical protein